MDYLSVAYSSTKRHNNAHGGNTFYNIILCMCRRWTTNLPVHSDTPEERGWLAATAKSLGIGSCWDRDICMTTLTKVRHGSTGSLWLAGWNIEGKFVGVAATSRYNIIHSAILYRIRGVYIIVMSARVVKKK